MLAFAKCIVVQDREASTDVRKIGKADNPRDDRASAEYFPP